MGIRPSTRKRMQDRVARLIKGFDSYVDVFDQAKQFTGPSLYFHSKTLDLLRQHDRPIDAINNHEYFESMYATLASWGMHRMGSKGAKLVELSDLIDSFRQQISHIQQIESLTIWDVDTQDVREVGQRLWEIMGGLRVGTGKTKIVAGAKALHHLLPNLIPPIDREYTIRFFFHSTTLNHSDEKVFNEIFPHFHRISVNCREEIGSWLGTGMNTSITKVIDNAIVGYGLLHLKK